MQYFDFNDIDYEKYNGEHIYGRIRMYDPGKGYGFISTEDGKDIFISSYSFKNTDERFAILGTALKFKIEQRNSRYCAYDVKIINPTLENQSILLPNGEKLLIRKISNYGIIDGIRSCKKIGVSAEDVLAHDIAIWKLEYVYISLIRNHGEYRFFKKF